MRNLFANLVLCTALCVSSGTAAADVFYDTYQRGLTAFKARDYTDARSEFLRAYDLRPEPIILFNIAQTYRLESNSEQALLYYKRFLAESKIAKDLRDEAEAYVAQLEAEQRAQDEQKTLDANAGPKERDGTPVTLTTPPMDRPSSSPPNVPPRDAENKTADASTHESDTMLTTRRKVALVSATSGALALATGAVLGVSANTRQRNAHALCPDPQIACDSSRQANDLVRSGHNLALGANIAFAVGASAIIVAGIFWFTGARESHHRTAVLPSVSSTEAIITLYRSF